MALRCGERPLILRADPLRLAVGPEVLFATTLNGVGTTTSTTLAGGPRTDSGR